MEKKILSKALVLRIVNRWLGHALLTFHNSKLKV